MKILVMGDSHGNIANLKHVMGFAKKIKAGAIIHTGDWDNGLSLRTVYDYKIPLYTVLGNADSSLLKDKKDIEAFKKKNKEFSYGVYEINKRKIGVIHSFKASESWYKDCDIVFCGHRHSQDDRIVNGVRMVRPGALALGIYFVVYDTKTNNVEFIHE